MTAVDGICCPEIHVASVVAGQSHYTFVSCRICAYFLRSVISTTSARSSEPGATSHYLTIPQNIVQFLFFVIKTYVHEGVVDMEVLGLKFGSRHPTNIAWNVLNSSAIYEEMRREGFHGTLLSQGIQMTVLLEKPHLGISPTSACIGFPLWFLLFFNLTLKINIVDARFKKFLNFDMCVV